MEIDTNLSSNLVDLTEKFLQGINHWNWSELIVALKQCQDLRAKDSSFLIEKILDALIGRVAAITVARPFACSSSSSSENFSSLLSSDTSSICSTRNSFSTPSIFEDLARLNVRFFDKLVKMMVFKKLDHCTIFKLLIHYLKSRLLSTSTRTEKREIVEVVIGLLLLLERSSLSCKGLFEILRIVSRLKRRSKCCELKLERLIGSKLDQATIDQLMIPSPSRKYNCPYDVNLVLRFAEAYVLERWMLVPDRMKKVGSLIDSYLIEVAADFRLKPSKFAALAMVIPESARESSDKLYHAIDLYLQVHTQLCEVEKMRICCALNHDKLSEEALKHLAQNSKFPSKKSVQDFVVNLQQSDLNNKYIMSRKQYEYVKEIGNLDSHLHKVCGKVESKSKKMPNVIEPRNCNSAKIRYMPRFC